MKVTNEQMSYLFEDSDLNVKSSGNLLFSQVSILVEHMRKQDSRLLGKDV